MKNIPYQQNAVNELTDKTIRLLNLGGKRHKIVFEAPTGAGKTVMTCQALANITDELKERGDSRSVIKRLPIYGLRLANSICKAIRA